MEKPNKETFYKYNLFLFCATVSSLACLGLAISQSVIRSFVTVVLVTNNSDSTDLKYSCEIGGLGVYVAEYDPTCLGEEVIAISRVPTEIFEAPTAEFKLLFPAQENLVAEALPITPALLELFDFYTNNSASLLLAEPLENIIELEFEDCDQYMEDAFLYLSQVFTRMNNILLPQLVPLITTPIIFTVQSSLLFLNSKLGAVDPANNLLVELMGGSFELVKPYFPLVEASAAPFCNGLTAQATAINETLTPALLACVGSTYSQVSAGTTGFLSGFLSNMGTHFTTTCAAVEFSATGAPAIACYLLIDYVWNDAGLLGALDISGSSYDFCAVFSNLCTGSSTRLGLFNVMYNITAEAAVVAESLGNAEIVVALQTASQGFGLGLTLFAIFQNQMFASSPATTSQILGIISTTPSQFPNSFEEFYVPCGVILLAKASGYPITTLPALENATDCSFEEFFPAATELATIDGNSLADTLASLTLLYGACAFYGAAPKDCGLLFPALFLNGAYQGGLEPQLEGFNASYPEEAFDVVIPYCEDDNTDIEYISQAQFLLGASLGFYFMTFVAGLMSLFVERGKICMQVFAGVCAVLAALLNMLALLRVQAAPVYQSVGEPDPEYVTPLYTVVYLAGIVPYIAFISIILILVAAGCYCCGACFEAKRFKRNIAVEGEGKIGSEFKQNEASL